MVDRSENSRQNALFRARLRRERIALREGMAPEARTRASAAIEAHLKALLLPRTPGVIAFCWPIRAEFDARSLIRHLLLDRGWITCIPVVEQVDQPMVFRAWSPNKVMARDVHGIPIPAASPRCHPDVVLLPLVAFDGRGYRLGYGGGYFDRTLAVLNPRPWTIGVGYELGRVDTIRPESHDVPLDLCVTEAGVSTPNR